MTEFTRLAIILIVVGAIGFFAWNHITGEESSGDGTSSETIVNDELLQEAQ